MKKFVTSLAGVPEGLHDEYEETDGGFVLKLEDDEFKDKLNEFRTNNRKLFGEVKALQESQEKFKDIDPERYQKAMQALEKIEDEQDRELMEAGDVEALVKRRTGTMKHDYEKQVQAKEKALQTQQGELEKLRGNLHHLTVTQKLGSTVEQLGFRLKPNASTFLNDRARDTWTINDEGHPVPMRGKDVIYGATGDVMSMEEWVAKQVEDAPFLFETGGGGGGGGNDQRLTSLRKKTVDGSDPMAVGDNLEDIASGKLEVT